MSETPETRYAKAPDGSFVAYQTQGHGPIDVFWMFAGAIPIESTLDDPRTLRFRERLASFGRVICHDRRGVGLSDPIASFDAATLEVRATDALAVLDATGSETAAIVATDYSAGDIAVMLATLRPERIKALVLNNPAPRKRLAPDYPWGLSDAELTSLVEAWRQDLQRGESSAFTLLTGSTSEDDPARAWWIRSVRRGMRLGQVEGGLQLVMGTDARSLLPNVRAPVLVVHDAPFASWRTSDHARYTVQHLAEAQQVELRGSHIYVYASPVADAFVDLAEQFITGDRSPPVVTDRRLATILFTDIVSSTARAAAMGDRRWTDLLDQHDGVVARQLERHRGHLVNPTGDGVVATFDGPARAVRCAQAILEELKTLGVDARAGVHTGEVEVRRDDIAGIAVKIGQRVSALAGAGEVLVSRTVMDLVIGSGLQFEARGEYELKGVPGSWAIYLCRSD